MKNMRVLIIGAAVTASAIVVVTLTFVVGRAGRGRKEMKPDFMVVSLKLSDGSTQKVEARRWPEPYVVQYRPSDANFDLSKPEEVADALWSTPNRDPDRYLALLDPMARDRVIQVDRESGGKLLAPSLKGEPFPTSEKTFFTHYVDLIREGKKYRVLVGKAVVDGVEYSGLTVTLVQSNGGWFQSFDLDNSPLLTEIGLRSFDDLIQSRKPK